MELEEPKWAGTMKQDGTGMPVDSFPRASNSLRDPVPVAPGGIFVIDGAETVGCHEIHGLLATRCCSPMRGMNMFHSGRNTQCQTPRTGRGGIPLWT